MKEKVDFLICYEHKGREIESIALLKKELEKRGYTVIIFSSYEVNLYRYPQLSKEVRCILTPNGYSTESLFCWCFSVAGCVRKIINLQWEQLLAIIEEEDINAYHNPKGLAKEIVHLCWGESTKERLVWAGVNKSKIFVTGPMQLDILRKPYIDKLISREMLSKAFSLDNKKKWVLFISSFSLNDLDEYMKESYKFAMGEEYYNYFYNFSNESRDKILDWFEKYINQNNDTIIIYRPHPDEVNKTNRLLQLETKYKNFRIISERGVIDWIKNSDVILNWYSTSEAYIYFSKCKELLVRPVKIKPEYDISIFSKRTCITTYDDFIKEMNQIDKKIFEESDVMSTYYDFNLEKSSYERVADICEMILNTNSYDLHLSFKIVFTYYKRKLIVYIKKLLLLKLKILEKKYKRISEYHEFLLKGYDRNVASPEEIEEIQNRMVE